jgi:5'-nucleotidase
MEDLQHNNLINNTMNNITLNGKIIDTLVFDMDGTLFGYDDHNSSIDSEAEVLKYITKRFPHLTINSIHKLFQECMDVDRKIWFKNFLTKLNIDQSIDLDSFAQDLETLYWVTFSKVVSPYQDAIYFLEQIKGKLNIAMITDGYTKNQKYKIFACGLHNYFDLSKIVYSDEVGVKKPDAKIFEYAFHKCSINPEKSAYIGDKLNKDILGANNANMTSIFLRRGYNSLERISHTKIKPDIEVSNFYELLNMLKL